MSKILKCIAVDDDKMSLKILEGLIENTRSLQLVGTYSDPVEASNVLQSEQVDLLFLDVEMPAMSGLDLIGTLEKTPQIIIVSSKEKYALDSYDYNVTDFLLKPVENYARFLKAVQKAIKNDGSTKGPNEEDHIFIKVDSLLLNFNYQDIYWVEAYGDYVKIHTDQKVYTVYCTLKMMEEKLPHTEFIRVHRSYIVRIDKIKNIDQNNLQIRDKIIPISNSYRGSFFKRINTL